MKLLSFLPVLQQGVSSSSSPLDFFFFFIFHSSRSLSFLIVCCPLILTLRLLHLFCARIIQIGEKKTTTRCSCCGVSLFLATLRRLRASTWFITFSSIVRVSAFIPDDNTSRWDARAFLTNFFSFFFLLHLLHSSVTAFLLFYFLGFFYCIYFKCQRRSKIRDLTWKRTF